MKTKIIPFDLETAKKIQAGEIQGRICSKEGNFTARIICFDKTKLVSGDGTTEKQIVSLIYNENAREEILFVHNLEGEVQTQFYWEHSYDLVLEVPDNEPQFKPFDRVLVRMNDDQVWHISLYESCGNDGFYVLHGIYYKQCIAYEGNEYFVGTINKPKEE